MISSSNIVVVVVAAVGHNMATNVVASVRRQHQHGIIKRCITTTSSSTRIHNNNSNNSNNKIRWFKYNNKINNNNNDNDKYRYSSNICNSSRSFSIDANTHDNNNRNEALLIKDHIIQLTLEKYIIQYGWTNEAIIMGTKEYMNNMNKDDVNSSISISGLCNIYDLITACMNQWNNNLKNELYKDIMNNNHDINATNITERIQQIHHNTNTNNDEIIIDHILYAMKIRLMYMSNMIKANRWHEGMALGLHPFQITITQNQIKNMIHIICDDYIFQRTGVVLSSTEHISLGAIYIMTELHMLNDTSTNYNDTWIFLTERLNEWQLLRNTPSTIPTINPNDITSSSMNMMNMNRIMPPSTSTSSLNDTIRTMTHIVSSLAGGAISIFNPPSSSSTTNQNNNSYNTNRSFSNFSTSTTTNNKDGTDPSHYK